MEFLIVKWVHILSATVLFGTGLGSAFYKYMADRHGDLQTIANTNKTVVIADWVFTTPTVILQPITGIILMSLQGYSMTEPWLMLSIALFILAGLCWLYVVYLQISMRNLSLDAIKRSAILSEKYFSQAKRWFWLGVSAFTCIIVVYYLMVFKPVIVLQII